ncbi:MAG TPA: helix-turn-helix domain-containing protein [Deltaproteobacteria bacterium]|nr:helix-turn-helix domain-containing protein [Deltaproteobacteria bacterium]
MHRVLVLCLDGVVDSSLALSHDTIETANRLAIAKGLGVRFETTFVHPTRKRIRTGMGATVEVHPVSRIRRADSLIIPGLGLATAEEIERFFSTRATRVIVDWLREAGPRCGYLGASCSGVFLLGEAGLLKDRIATTTWWLGPVFRARHPEVDLDESRMLATTGSVVCAGAALAHVDLMLHLVARKAGPLLSREVSRYLAIDERPSQARYMMLSALSDLGDEVGRVERWIRQNLARPFSIVEMAKALGMSPRTLDRRIRRATGLGPSRFLQRVRLEHAVHLLETSDQSIAEVAECVGYRDPTSLRRSLRRNLDLNPREVRRNSG